MQISDIDLYVYVNYVYVNIKENVHTNLFVGPNLKNRLLLMTRFVKFVYRSIYANTNDDKKKKKAAC